MLPMSVVSQPGNVSKFKNVERKRMKLTTFEDIPLPVKLLTAGTAACIADTVTFPLDTAKVRLQVQGEGLAKGQAKMASRYTGVVNTVATIAREEGARSLYSGLVAGLQRQMCFASIRLGLYDSAKSFYENLIGDGAGEKRARVLDVFIKISAGMTTGALAVLVAQPTDVVKVRFQAQRGTEERYTSTTEAYKTIYRDEGVRGLWKGTVPNVARNGIVNVSEIVCYDIVKDIILRNGFLADNIVCHFFSAIVAGFCTTVASSPVDVVKTRYMNSPPGQYKSPVDCGVQTLLKEGPLAFYKGFRPSFSRLVSWNIVMWISYEKLKLLVTSVLNDK